jgi:hypothetical protein
LRQSADTGEFTDYLFGISAMLGYRLVLRMAHILLSGEYLWSKDAAA